jgi:hypothetical protein
VWAALVLNALDTARPCTVGGEPEIRRLFSNGFLLVRAPACAPARLSRCPLTAHV